MFGEKSLLMGDEIADSVLEYARLLGAEAGTDTVTVHAIGADGNTVDVALLLNSSSVMVVESTNSDVEPPDNDEAARYVHERIDRLRTPPEARSEDRAGDFELHDLDIPDKA